MSFIPNPHSTVENSLILGSQIRDPDPRFHARMYSVRPTCPRRIGNGPKNKTRQQTTSTHLSPDISYAVLHQQAPATSHPFVRSRVICINPAPTPSEPPSSSDLAPNSLLVCSCISNHLYLVIAHIPLSISIVDDPALPEQFDSFHPSSTCVHPPLLFNSYSPLALFSQPPE